MKCKVKLRGEQLADMRRKEKALHILLLFLVWWAIAATIVALFF